ncbi:MAG: 3-deoxy-manno-octulosonate cytidylyltransferase [Bacteroidetes bacterium]|nr:3-deoxy-manno-octulosonate cytidylyltransferase [Bacteroidota bacterium]MBT7141791.1 3-deoxy-manno-octulosonate cytidylyltransferase [Bacteroidota bacterium]MBT7492710.1 3-deoxy-manno-octulosonate cytidylyltransferase [Bacteroidota bacterium]
MKIVAIIPARYASTRFPGKPLVSIKGKTMICRVFEQVSKAIDTVFVATDDNRIESEVKKFCGNVVLTSEFHQSGTDRCAEAVVKIQKLLNIEFDIVINVQGDEPFIHPNQISSIISAFENKSTQIATLAKKIENSDELSNPNVVKLVLNNKNEAIYFSRSSIPYVREVENREDINKHQFYKHIGLYGYSKNTLLELTKLDQTPLEIVESLEQLRWIENDYKIKVSLTEHESISIDTKDDLEILLENHL